MKKIALFALLAACVTVTAAEHAIAARKNSEQPSSFYEPQRSGFIKCVKNAQGKLVFRVDAKAAARKLISGRRIAIGENDALTLRLTINSRAESTIGAGFYIYCQVGKNARHLGAVNQPVFKIVPGRKVYEFTKTVPPNKKAKSAFEKPSIGLIFFDFRKGSDLDVEKIEYFVKKAPKAAAPAIPDF